MNLLVGYDGSQCATQAIEDLANARLPATHVTATVASIADILPMAMEADVAALPTPAAREWARRARDAFDDIRRLADEGTTRLRRVRPDWDVRPRTVADSPHWGLVTLANETGANLIVVGSHGRTAVGRFFLGSVSFNTVLYAKCTARIGRRKISAKDDGRPPEELKPVRLVVGWDGSTNAEATVNEVASRSWPSGSQVRLVTALDVRLATFMPAVDLVAIGYPAPMPTALPRDMEETLRAGAGNAAARLRASGFEVAEPVMRLGNPKHVLIDEAKAWDADCVFVGAHGLSRVERAILGSVSGAVAERSPCSVEVVRMQGINK
jgi:nucleotide-binding universal stress UspA family protein